MVELSYEDKVQQYAKSIVLYKGIPVFVERVTEDGSLCLYDLKAQQSITVPFSLDNIKPPTKRIGMINILGSVLYVTRIPARKMVIGYYKNNMVFNTLTVPYPYGRTNTVDTVSSLDHSSIADAMNNEYPSLKQAIDLFAAGPVGAVAFDKQFAIDNHRNIFYKTNVVGSVPEGKDKNQEICFHENYTHLHTLLDGNHEKTYRTAVSK